MVQSSYLFPQREPGVALTRKFHRQREPWIVQSSCPFPQREIWMVVLLENQPILRRTLPPSDEETRIFHRTLPPSDEGGGKTEGFDGGRDLKCTIFRGNLD